MSKLVFLVNAPKNINITTLLQNSKPKVKCEMSNRSFSNTYQVKTLANTIATRAAVTNVNLPPRINSSNAFILTSRRREVNMRSYVIMRCLTVGQGNWSAKNVKEQTVENENKNEGKLVTKVEDNKDEIACDQSSNKTEVTYQPLNMKAIEDIAENVDRIVAIYISQQQKETLAHILKRHLIAIARNEKEILGSNLDFIGEDRDNSPTNTDIPYLPLNIRAIKEITENLDSITAVHLTQQQREKFLLILKSNLVAVAINERAESRKKSCDRQRMLIAKTAGERELVPEYIMAPKLSEENSLSFTEGPDLRLSTIVLPDLSSPSKPPENIEAQEIFNDRFLEITESVNGNPQKESDGINVENKEVNKQSE